MEDATTLRDHSFQQNDINIIDLSIHMSAAATPSSASHTSHPPSVPTPTTITGVPLLSAARNDHTSPPANAVSHSKPEQTTTMINFCVRTLDEFFSAALQPDLSEVVTVLAQLSELATGTEQTTTSQAAPLSQRKHVIWAPPDQQLPDATPQPTSPPLELGKPSVPGVITAPSAYELPSQAAPMDMPMPQIITVSVRGSGHTLSFHLSLDTTIAFLKQVIQLTTVTPSSHSPPRTSI
jgi:hypothetical protein